METATPKKMTRCAILWCASINITTTTRTHIAFHPALECFVSSRHFRPLSQCSQCDLIHNIEIQLKISSFDLHTQISVDANRSKNSIDFISINITEQSSFRKSIKTEKTERSAPNCAECKCSAIFRVTLNCIVIVFGGASRECEKIYYKFQKIRCYCTQS